MAVDYIESKGKSELEKPQWTVIKGRVVDLSTFRHPGGNIIKYFQGIDGTSAFESFHRHSKKAQLMLKSLPEVEEVVDVPEQKPEHVVVMTQLLAKWKADGLFEPRLAVSTAYGATVFGAIVAAVALAPYVPISAGLLMGTAWAHCGFLQHMGGHRELGAISLVWQHFFEGLCKGGSASWWRGRHNKHHAKTNVIGEDGDLRTTPFFAWDEQLAKKVPDWSLRTQAFTFLPALGAYVFIFFFTVRKYAVVKKLWHEVVLMAAHYIIFAWGLSKAGCGLSDGLTMYTVAYAFQGIYLGFFFGLSHFAVERVPASATWLESTMIGTIDWAV